MPSLTTKRKLDIVTRKNQGQSVIMIAMETRINRDTIYKYLNKLMGKENLIKNVNKNITATEYKKIIREKIKLAHS